MLAKIANLILQVVANVVLCAGREPPLVPGLHCESQHTKEIVIKRFSLPPPSTMPWADTASTR